MHTKERETSGDYKAQVNKIILMTRGIKILHNTGNNGQEVANKDNPERNKCQRKITIQ